MGFLDSLAGLFKAPESINWNQGGTSVLSTGGPFGSLGNAVQSLRPLANQMDNYQQQQTMNNVFAANPQFAAQLYGAQNDLERTNNQSALLQLQQQEQQQKLKQQQGLQALASQVGGSPLEQLLAQTAPGSLADMITQQQKLAQDKARQTQIASVLTGQPTSSLSPPGLATAGAASGPNPLSIRNNNPGNIKDTKTGEFQSFKSPEEGLAAMTRDLTLKLSGKSPVMMQQYGQGYVPTLSNLIPTWAPASDKNNTDAYIQAVSQATGIDSTKPLSVADLGKLQPAMINHEGGQVAGQYFGTSPRQELQAPGSSDRQPLQAPQYPDEIKKMEQIAAITGDPNDAMAVLKAKADFGAPGTINKDQVEKEMQIRKEFEGLSTPFINARDAFLRVKASAKDPSAAGDLALIYNYMKVLDPGSTVRESEFQLAGQAGSLPTQIQAAFDKLSTGKRLTDDMRKDFVSRSKDLYSAQEKQHKVLANQYKDLVKPYGYDAGRVVPDFTKDVNIEEPPVSPTGSKKSVNGVDYLQVNGQWYQQ